MANNGRVLTSPEIWLDDSSWLPVGSLLLLQGCVAISLTENMELKTNVQIVKFNWAGSQPVTHSPVTKDRQRLDRFVSSKKEKLQNRQNKTLAQIHLRPLCYLGNSQSGVHVVRKTALNYSERENVRQTCGHSPPNMGLKTRCMHHVRVFYLAHGDRIMAHLDIICKGCPFLLMEELFNLIDLTKPM